MSQHKIVTNRPSTKINCDKSSIHFGTYHSFLCDISSRTSDKLSVTYVTSNLCPNQWTICLKKGAICFIQTDMIRHIRTHVVCRIIIIRPIYCNSKGSSIIVIIFTSVHSVLFFVTPSPPSQKRTLKMLIRNNPYQNGRAS